MKKSPADFSIATGGEAAGARPKDGYRRANKRVGHTGRLLKCVFISNTPVNTSELFGSTI